MLEWKLSLGYDTEKSTPTHHLDLARQALI